MIIESLETRGDLFLVNSNAVKVWGPHTWSPHDSDEELAEWQAYLLLIGATADRDWVGWLTGEGDLITTRGDIRRAGRHARWCVQNGIVDQISLLQATRIELPKLTNAHKRHIDRVLDEVGDLDGKIILEVANEASLSSFSKDGVQYLRSRGWRGLIAVNTGKNGPVKELEDTGADIIAVTPGYSPDGDHVLEMDDDHTSPGKNSIPYFERWHERASIFRIMLAWDDPDLPGIESHIPGWNKPWNDPNNALIPGKIKWCQDHIGNQIGDGTKPPPEPSPETFNLLDFMVPTDPRVVGNRFGTVSANVIGNRIAYVKWLGQGADIWVHNGKDLFFYSTEGLRNERGEILPENVKVQRPPKRVAPLECPVGKPGSKVVHWKALYDLIEGCEVKQTLDLARESYEVYAFQRARNPDGLGPIGGLVPDSTRTVKIHHKWNNGVSLEVFVFAEGFGPVRHTRIDNGRIVRTSTNNELRGTFKKLDFPCDRRLEDPEWEMPIEIPPDTGNGSGPGGNGGSGGGGGSGCALLIVLGATLLTALSIL